jgi:hypothetical protein
MTSIFLQNGRPQFLGKIEDNLNFWQNGYNLNILAKWKSASIFIQMEDYLNCKIDGK